MANWDFFKELLCYANAWFFVATQSCAHIRTPRILHWQPICGAVRAQSKHTIMVVPHNLEQQPHRQHEKHDESATRSAWWPFRHMLCTRRVRLTFVDVSGNGNPVSLSSEPRLWEHGSFSLATSLRGECSLCMHVAAIKNATPAGHIC